MNQYLSGKIKTYFDRLQVGQTKEQKDILLKCANASYPILHETVLELVCDFLDHKKKYGNEVRFYVS